MRSSQRTVYAPLPVMSSPSFDPMLVDFHTHIFPDKIARKTIDFLAEKASIGAFSDGTASGLLTEMARAGADISVTLPVLTNPAQFDSVNRFASEINTRFANEAPRLISFAGIHPACEEIEKKMAWIRENGFLGVKIHPDYQGTFITDEGYLKILHCAKEYDLIVVTHAGVDAGYRDMPVRCPPELALQVIRQVNHGKFVLAHLGGSEMSEQVLDLLAGEDVYLDTAYVLRYTSGETFRAIVQKHGADRILFASDSPWSGIREDVALLHSFELDKTTEDKILFGNARRLLGI